MESPTPGSKRVSRTCSQRLKRHRTHRITDPFPAYRLCIRSSHRLSQREGIHFLTRTAYYQKNRRDQLLVEAKSKKKNLSTAWIDYKKAFDSVPHTGIEKCLEIYQVFPTTIKLIVQSMKNWKTTLNLHHVNGSVTSRPINIKSGIFQGHLDQLTSKVGSSNEIHSHHYSSAWH